MNLANLFAKNGHKVTMIVLDNTAEVFYPLDENISIVQENLRFGIGPMGNMVTRKIQFLSHLFRLRKIYKTIRPDYIITTEYSLTVPSVFATTWLRSKLISWEHHHFYWIRKNRFWSVLFRYTYPKVKMVVTQNSIEKILFEKIGCKSTVIPYVVPQQNKSAALANKTILSIGWLIKRKGIDLLPSVAEKVFAKYPDWKWKVIGEGEEYDRLKNEINRRGLQNNIVIQKPVSPNLQDEYLAASIFVLLSRFECLPLVLLEATTFGLPCVAFDCPTGPGEIIHNNSDGFVLPLEDVNAIASAIITLINDEVKRKEFGKAAKYNGSFYADKNVYQKWIDLFQQLESNPT